MDDGAPNSIVTRLGALSGRSALLKSVKTAFYTVRTVSGDQYDEVEKALSQIEGAVKPVLDQLAARNDILDEQRQWTSAFMTTLYLRTPGFRRTHDAMYEAMLKQIIKIRYSDPHAAAAAIEQMKAADKDIGDLTPEEIAEAAQHTDRYSIEFSSGESIRSMVSLLPRIGPLLADMTWTVVHAPPNKSFVTSDEPFVLLPPPDYKPGVYGVGIATSGATKIVPLSQQTCAVIGDLRPGSPVRHVDVTGDWVRAINMNVTANCERFVIGPVEPLVRSLVTATAVDHRGPPQRFQVGNPPTIPPREPPKTYHPRASGAMRLRFGACPDVRWIYTQRRWQFHTMISPE